MHYENKYKNLSFYRENGVLEITLPTFPNRTIAQASASKACATFRLSPSSWLHGL
jgi:hypothetical protein